MKDGSLEMKWLSGLSNSLLSGAKGAKVLGSLGDVLPKQPQHDATLFSAFNFDIKEYFGGDFNLAVMNVCVCMCVYGMLKNNSRMSLEFVSPRRTLRSLWVLGL